MSASTARRVGEPRCAGDQSAAGRRYWRTRKTRLGGAAGCDRILLVSVSQTMHPPAIRAMCLDCTTLLPAFAVAASRPHYREPRLATAWYLAIYIASPSFPGTSPAGLDPAHQRQRARRYWPEGRRWICQCQCAPAVCAVGLAARSGCVCGRLRAWLVAARLGVRRLWNGAADVAGRCHTKCCLG